MKILVISLLRLGDILLSTSVISSLRKQYPNAEIHVLINKQFHRISQMIPGVSKVYHFDRTGIQNMIGQKDHSLLEAYFRVEDLVEELREQHFDQVINLTHNRLSGWITTLIKCPNTQGVMFREDGKLSLGSPWFDYLNKTTEHSWGKPFHFVDVFHYGTGLSGTDRGLHVKESDSGKKFASEVISQLDGKKVICIQPGSFEQKKTLKPDVWKRIISDFIVADPLAVFLVLGAPNETDLVESICASQSQCAPLICELDEAYSILKRASLLVSTDTSIKHLAAAAGSKIIEISIGSSDYLRTGAFIDGAIILQGNAPCAPCPHSSPCSQARHICGEAIEPSMVAMTMRAYLNSDEEALRTLAFEYKDSVTVLRTSVNAMGDWCTYPLASNFEAKQIAQWVDRVSIKLQLQKVMDEPIGEYGSEWIELRKIFLSMFPNQTPKEWLGTFKTLESQYTAVGENLEGLMKSLKETLSAFEDSQRLKTYVEGFGLIAKEMARSPGAQSYGVELQEVLSAPASVPFLTLAKMREGLTKAYQRYKIEMKLIRGLQSEFTEII